MVRVYRGIKEQDSVTTTKAPGRKQGPGRHERRIAQPCNGPGRPIGSRGAEAETPGLLRAVRRDENVYEHHHWGDRIGVWLFGDQIFSLNR